MCGQVHRDGLDADSASEEPARAPEKLLRGQASPWTDPLPMWWLPVKVKGRKGAVLLLTLRASPALLLKSAISLQVELKGGGQPCLESPGSLGVLLHLTPLACRDQILVAVETAP